MSNRWRGFQNRYVGGGKGGGCRFCVVWERLRGNRSCVFWALNGGGGVEQSELWRLLARLRVVSLNSSFRSYLPEGRGVLTCGPIEVFWCREIGEGCGRRGSRRSGARTKGGGGIETTRVKDVSQFSLAMADGAEGGQLYQSCRD